MAGLHGRPVTLDDGSILGGKSYGNHVGMIRDWTLVAVNLLKSQLANTPTQPTSMASQVVPSWVVCSITLPGAISIPRGESL